jgi:8-oxo-dGTP diphosphatase
MASAQISTETNAFGGEIVDPASVERDPDRFRDQLSALVTASRKRGTKVVWLALDLSRAALIPVAVDAGFTFHHAAGAQVQMTICIVEGSYVPPYATHYIGVGGVVLKDPKTMLVVAERYGKRSRRHYKLPGGALHAGEHIEEAVTREVLEETGIETSFISLNCFRHWHGYRHGKSDIYFVCRLEALTHEISRQEEEIEECLWMPIAEYLAHADVHAFNKRVVRAVLSEAGLKPEPIEGYGTPKTHELFMPFSPSGTGDGRA